MLDQRQFNSVGQVRTTDSRSLDPLSNIVVGQIDVDVTFEQCVLSDRNLACAVLNRHKTQSDGEVNMYLLP